MKKSSQIVILTSLVVVTSLVLGGCSYDKKAMKTEPDTTMVKQETNLVVTPSADPAAEAAAVDSIKTSKTSEAAVTATTDLDKTFAGMDTTINENDLDDSSLGM